MDYRLEDGYNNKREKRMKRRSIFTAMLSVFLSTGFIASAQIFEQSQEQVTQGGHNLSGFGPADSRSVLAQTDIPAVVRAAFNGPPVVASGLEQLFGAILTWGGAGAAVASGTLQDNARKKRTRGRGMGVG